MYRLCVAINVELLHYPLRRQRQMCIRDRYIGIIEIMKEAIWLQRLLDNLRIEQDLLNINCDSMSAIYLAKNQVYHARTKHIDVKFHFVWEILDEGGIELKKIRTKENLTDMFTKVVPQVKFAHCKELIHILQIAWVQWGSFRWTTDGLISQERVHRQPHWCTLIESTWLFVVFGSDLKNLYRDGEL